MLRHSADNSSPPDVERFRQRMREHPGDAVHDYAVNESRGWTFFKMVAFGMAAASAAIVAISLFWFVTVTYPAGIESQRELARAQRIGALLPALSNESPQSRSLALVLAQQVDPVFAAETAARLQQWEASQSQAQVAANRIQRYSTRIFEGLQKLQWSRDPSDREIAIWQDLLPVLKEAQRDRDDFINVAIEYRKVLPLLRVNEATPFRESYWGELWIYNILLGSKINPVVQIARQTAPPISVVQQVLREHGDQLPAEKRQAFQEAVQAYENTLKTVQ